MSNHVHLLVTPGHRFSIGHLMRDLGRNYVGYINRTHRRKGTLWEGRYKASLVDGENYLLSCMRYIEMNPVRAGMVNNPGAYLWSSYARNAYGKKNLLVTPHPLYEALGPDSGGREQTYRELFRRHLDDAELGAIREALQQEQVLGSDEFKHEVAQRLERQPRPGVRGKAGRRGISRDLQSAFAERRKPCSAPMNRQVKTDT